MEQLRAEFLESTGKMLACRQQAMSMGSLRPAERIPILLKIYEAIRQISSRAGAAGFSRIGKLGSAIESFIKDLFEQPDHLNASSLRTISQVLEALFHMAQNPANSDKAETFPLCLVVDDEIISRQTACSSLGLVQIPAVAAARSETALELIEENAFGLILLDVEMPGHNGYELCERIRKNSLNAETPVLFITSLAGFDSRAKSLVVGGTDFLTKPFMPLELALKAMRYFYCPRLETSC
jgi:CheY-like chemotaxis protein